MIHGKAMAVVVAYDMYLECCEGNVDPAWKVEKPVDFFGFREQLALQMLQYTPKANAYPGDSKFRVATVVNKSRRMKKRSASNASLSTSGTHGPTGVKVTQFDLDYASGRLCGDMNKLVEHQASLSRLPNGNTRLCAACGKPATHQCGLCPDKPALHTTIGSSCFTQWHNTQTFGMWKDDWRLSRGKRSTWTNPEPHDLVEQGRYMDRLQLSLCLPTASEAEAPPIASIPAAMPPVDAPMPTAFAQGHDGMSGLM